MCPCAEDDWDEEGLEKVLKGRIGRHVSVLFLSPVGRRGKDTIIGKRGEIHCLGGLKDHLERGGGVVVLERMVGGSEVMVGVYSDVGDAEGHGGQGSTAPSRREVQDSDLGGQRAIDGFRHLGAKLIDRSIPHLEYRVEVCGTSWVTFVASAQRAEMLYRVWVMKGLVEREATSSLGLRLKPMGEEEAVQSRKAGSGSVRVFKCLVGADGLLV